MLVATTAYANGSQLRAAISFLAFLFLKGLIHFQHFRYHCDYHLWVQYIVKFCPVHTKQQFYVVSGRRLNRKIANRNIECELALTS